MTLETETRTERDSAAVTRGATTDGNGRADRDAILLGALPAWRRAFPGAATGILSALSTVALMAASAFLITRAAEQPPIMFLTMAVVGVRAFALGRAFFRYLERLTTHDAVLRQIERVRVDLVRRLIPLAATAGRGRRGTTLEAMISDVDELQNLSVRVVQPLVASAGVAVLSVIGVSLLSPAAGIGLAVCILLAVIVAVLAVHGVSGRADTSIAPMRSALADAVLDYVGSLDVLIAYGAEREYRDRVLSADAELTRVLRRRAVGAGVAAAALVLFAGVAVMIALFAGIPAVAAGTLGGPALAVMVLVPLAVFEVIAPIPLALSAWRQVRTSAGRIADIAPTVPPREVAVAQPEQRTSLPVGEPGSRAIELVDASATWPGAGGPSLLDVSLSIAHGERVLVEGASGAGKSTLAAVLTRMLEVDGVYRVNGVAVTEVTPAAVRSVVGLCEQQPYLFDETIRQNLLFARDDAGDDDLMRVLERVGLAAWVTERGGLDASVGERGALVSGGQAQRLALARALLRDVPVIVFDEPTANVELDLAERLIADLLSASADRTVILISHADIADRMIDRRLVMVDGRIVEQPPTAEVKRTP